MDIIFIMQFKILIAKGMYAFHNIKISGAMKIFHKITQIYEMIKFFIHSYIFKHSQSFNGREIFALNLNR